MTAFYQKTRKTVKKSFPAESGKRGKRSAWFWRQGASTHAQVIDSVPLSALFKVPRSTKFRVVLVFGGATISRSLSSYSLSLRSSKSE